MHQNEIFNFNPTLVWFSLSAPPYKSYRQTRFQSHLGLIFSGVVEERAWAVYHFNPTLVWFSHLRAPHQSVVAKAISIPPWSDFLQHTLAWLWDAKTISIPPWSDFLFHHLLREPRYYQFQSHLGLIFSYASVTSSAPWRRFQSHLGLIFSFPLLVVVAIAIIAFQSHLGLIFSAWTRLPQTPREVISIPPWSDFLHIHRHNRRNKE